MTDSRSEIEMTLRRIVRYWPLVLVAVVVAAALGVGYAMISAPAAGYQAAAPVRVVNITANPLAPSPDTVLAAAVSPEARASVIESLGASAAEGIGKVSAAADAKDRTLVRIVVTGTDPARAEAFANALAHEAVKRAQAVVGATSGGFEKIAEHNREVVAQLDTQIAELQKLVDANPKDSALRLALVTANGQRNAAIDQQTLYEINAAQWTGDATFPDQAKATLIPRSGSYVTGALQGAVIGLLVGLVTAVLAERAARRKSA